MPLIHHDAATGADAQMSRSRRKSVAGAWCGPATDARRRLFHGLRLAVPADQKALRDCSTAL